MTAVLSIPELRSQEDETVVINGKEFRVVGNGHATRADAALPRPSPAKASRAHRIIAKPLDGAPVASGYLTLTTVPPSVNALFFNRKSGKGRGKTLVYRNWQRDAGRELRDQPSWHVPGKVEIRIYLPAGTRGDADNRIKATLDALVNAGRIHDDKNVVKVSAEFSENTSTWIAIQGRATP